MSWAHLGAGAGKAALGCPDHDVVHTIAVNVTGVGDRIAQQLTRNTEVGVQDGSGAARTHVDVPCVRTGCAGVKRSADDGVRRTVVVDVVKLANGPSVRLTGLVTGPRMYW